MDKENFRTFMKSHPELLNNINNNTMTFQKYYDIYNIYGEDLTIWDKYMTEAYLPKGTNSSLKSDISINDIVAMIKNIDLDTLEKGVSGMQKAIALVQELASPKKTPQTYEPRPLYKYFED